MIRAPWVSSSKLRRAQGIGSELESANPRTLSGACGEEHARNHSFRVDNPAGVFEQFYPAVDRGDFEKDSAGASVLKCLDEWADGSPSDEFTVRKAFDHSPGWQIRTGCGDRCRHQTQTRALASGDE